MLKLIFKILLSPVVYYLLILRAMVKCFFIVPVLAIVHTLKYLILFIIVAGALAYFFSPTWAAVVLLIGVLGAIGNAKEIITSISNGIPSFFRGGWDFLPNTFREISEMIAAAKRRRQENEILKCYAQVADEFVGFDQIADVFMGLD